MKKFTLIISLISSLNCFGQWIMTTLPSGNLSCDNSSWKLVFYDEFNGNQINTEKWTTYYNVPQPGQPICYCLPCRLHDENENNLYFDENVEVSQGKLKLIAKKGWSEFLGHHRYYTSGVVQSFNKFYLGKFEIYAKLPSGSGFWPAFWLFGEDQNEIDIFEFGGNESEKIHTNLRGIVQGQYLDMAETYDNNVDFTVGYKLYTLEWETNHIIFKINNEEIRRIPRYKTLLGQPLYCDNYISGGNYLSNLLMPNYTLNIILNLAIGSSTTAYGGEPLPTTIFPNVFEIDYIRVYQRTPNNGYVDLCAGRGINGPNVICSGSKTYTFTGQNLNLIWTVSPNLIIDNQTTNSITVHPISSTLSASAWIKAIDDIPCTQTSYTKNIWIGRPTLPIVGDQELIVRQNGFAKLNYPAGTLTSVVWSKSGDITSITGTLTDAIYKAGASPGIGYVYANVTNACATVRQEMEVYIANIKFKLYPNPFSENFTLEISDENLENENNLRCTIYDTNHSVILEKSVSFGFNEFQIYNVKGLHYITVTKGSEILFSTNLIAN